MRVELPIVRSLVFSVRLRFDEVNNDDKYSRVRAADSSYESFCIAPTPGGWTNTASGVPSAGGGIEFSRGQVRRDPFSSTSAGATLHIFKLGGSRRVRDPRSLR